MSSTTEMTAQRERSNSASGGSSDPPIDNTSGDEAMSDLGTDSDSEEEMITALLRPLTPSRNLVDHTGPVPGDVPIPRGRISYNPMAGKPLPPAAPVQDNAQLPQPDQGLHR